MINHWRNLNERERWMLSIGFLSILLYLFYCLLYSPLTTAVNNKATQLLEKQQTLAWMQQIQQQPKKKNARKPTSNAKLLTFIGKDLAAGSLRQYPYQLQQTVSGDIQLSYELVPFNPFLSWLWSLSNHYAIVLKQFHADYSNTAGMVKLQVTITANSS